MSLGYRTHSHAIDRKMSVDNSRSDSINHLRQAEAQISDSEDPFLKLVKATFRKNDLVRYISVRRFLRHSPDSCRLPRRVGGNLVSDECLRRGQQSPPPDHHRIHFVDAAFLMLDGKFSIAVMRSSLQRTDWAQAVHFDLHEKQVA